MTTKGSGGTSVPATLTATGLVRRRTARNSETSVNTAAPPLSSVTLWGLPPRHNDRPPVYPSRPHSSCDGSVPWRLPYLDLALGLEHIKHHLPLPLLPLASQNFPPLRIVEDLGVVTVVVADGGPAGEARPYCRPALDIRLLLQPHGGHVILAAPDRHRSPTPAGMAPLSSRRDLGEA